MKPCPPLALFPQGKETLTENEKENARTTRESKGEYLEHLRTQRAEGDGEAGQPGTSSGPSSGNNEKPLTFARGDLPQVSVSGC